MPSNLFPLGDSALRVNPIFGQGCTKSIVDILTLDRTLRRCSSPMDSRRALAYYLDLHYARTDAFWRDTRLQDVSICMRPSRGDTEFIALAVRL